MVFEFDQLSSIIIDFMIWLLPGTLVTMGLDLDGFKGLMRSLQFEADDLHFSIKYILPINLIGGSFDAGIPKSPAAIPLSETVVWLLVLHHEISSQPSVVLISGLHICQVPLIQR